MSEWLTVTLDDVLKLQRGHDLPANERVSGSVPIIGSSGVTGFHSTARYQGPGVAIGRSGASIGAATFVAEDYWPLNTCLFVKDFRGNDQRWVYRLLDSVDFLAYNSGSAQPSLNRNFLGMIPVMRPPLGEQQAIAEVLGALDDKIAANTKLAATADLYMVSAYASATDTKDVELVQVSEFHNRRRIPLSAAEREMRIGEVPYYGATGVFGKVDEAIFNERLLLVGEDGSVINADNSPVAQYIWGPAWVNNHAHVLTGRGISTELLYQVVRKADVTALITGTVQPKLNMGNLKRLELRVPTGESLVRIETIVASMTAARRSLVQESRTLAATRDALLPQLMSGKIRVRDAEKLASEAGA